MRVAAALLWYSHGELSQSKAAEIAGTSRAEFIDELAHRRIAVVQVTAEELQDEILRRTAQSPGDRQTVPVVCIWMKRAIDGGFHFVTLKPSRGRSGNVSSTL